MKDKAIPPIKKPGPPTLGLAVVADLWLWGALLLYAPSYLGIPSGWEILFYIAGFIALIISFAGALTELGKLWQSEGLSYWGVSLVFLIPAVALYLSVEYQRITGTLSVVAKIAALLLMALGGPMFFQGIPYLFWKKIGGAQKSESAPDSQDRESKSEKLKTNLEVVANVIVALLALTTAIVTLIERIVP